MFAHQRVFPSSWTSFIAVLMIAGLAGTGLGCQKISDMKQAAEAATMALEDAQNATSSQEAGQKMGSAFEKLRKAVGGGEAVQAVDFRTLKTVLPASVPGLTQEDVRGERGSQMGFSTSKVEGIYTADGEPRQRLTVTITDLGSMSGVGAIAGKLNSWGSTDREHTRGYERSATIVGYDGMEKFQTYENGGSRGSLEFLVVGRFQVAVEGRNVPMETMTAAAEGIDVGALKGMKDAGVGAEDGAGERVAEMYEEFHRAEKQKKDGGETGAASGVRPTVVEAAELKALFPAQLAGLAQTSAESRSQALSEAMTIAQAEAQYADGDRRLSLHLTDYAEATATNGVLPGAAWLLFDVKRESDTGYEKTTIIAGHPAKETLRRRGPSVQCDVEMVIGKRFFLTVNANNLSMDEVKTAISQIELDRLQNLGQPAV